MPARLLENVCSFLSSNIDFPEAFDLVHDAIQLSKLVHLHISLTLINSVMLVPRWWLADVVSQMCKINSHLSKPINRIIVQAADVVSQMCSANTEQQLIFLL